MFSPAPLFRGRVRAVVEKLTLLAGAFFALVRATDAPAKVDLSFQADFYARLGYHLTGPMDLATHRHIAEVAQEAKWQRWTFAAGGRAYVESAFYENPRYASQPVAGLESWDYRLRDLYLQYRGTHWHFTIGNQQVVWGEAFGFYFADIVNPKDLRENGMGDLTYQRLMAPMINTSFFFGDAHLQLIVLPRTYFNILPNPGNDFAPNYQSIFPGQNLTVNRLSALDWFYSPEVGARFGNVIAGWDLNLFAFNYYDRTPLYTATIVPGAQPTDPLSITLNPAAQKITSGGLTATKDWGAFIQRAEIVATIDRAVNTIDMTQVPFGAPLGIERHAEVLGVLGFDYSQWAGYRLGLQVSHRALLNAPANLLVPSNKSQISVNWGGQAYREHMIDLVLSYVPQDGSSLLNGSYTVPAGSGIEVSLGGQYLAGGAGSQFGQFQGGSRAYLLLRAYFGAGK